MTAHATTELVVVGASWGGLRALQMLLGPLPRAFPCPIVVTQHRGADDGLDLAAAIGRGSPLPVADARDKEALTPGRVYLAPADYHLLIEDRASLALTTTDPVNSARPSIDVLFETAADAYGPAVTGVLLTGASADGAEGLARIESVGGVALVQDPRTAECSTMPAAAIAATRSAEVLSLNRLAGRLQQLVGLKSSR
jgi:two-component system chemotaxis response regulator CheB